MSDNSVADQSSDTYELSPFGSYIHATRYARWRDDLGRRETWTETVDRYVDFIELQCLKYGYELGEHKQVLRDAIGRTETMPSMRAMMTAGSAAERDNCAVFNCTAVAIDDPRAFDESMYLLMCGSGVGFSVERQFIKNLPCVPEELFPCDDVIVVTDSRKGWASAYRRFMGMLWAGHIPKWDLSKLRPSGARLKTFGGRSAGPGPLDELMRYTIEVFMGARGRKLNSIECHGIMCKIGDIVVSGGVRRSALLSLSNPSDDRMRDAKSGQWWEKNPHFVLANNSAAWTEKPDPLRFLDEWTSLVRSQSGERGIVNRKALQDQTRFLGKRDHEREFLVNPCAEIILRPQQMCNLSEIVVRADDQFEDLIRKATVAAIVGTIQSTFTDFKYLRSQWKKNCDEERLLGVSLTGAMDHPVLSQVNNESAEWLASLRVQVNATNYLWAEKLGITPSVATTCVKPSGTVSQLVGTASGLHARYADYYIRRTREAKNDPAAEVVRMAGVSCEEDVMKESNWVFSWPVKAPENSVTQRELSAIEQLDIWLHYRRNWCEHNPSVTVTVRDHEWIEVGAYVYKHFDEIGGVSFLPHSGHVYQQAPYEEITKEEYEQLLSEMPQDIDWNLLVALEDDDNTSGSRELACVAGACDLPDRV